LGRSYPHRYFVSLSVHQDMHHRRHPRRTHPVGHHATVGGWRRALISQAWRPRGPALRYARRDSPEPGGEISAHASRRGRPRPTTAAERHPDRRPLAGLRPAPRHPERQGSSKAAPNTKASSSSAPDLHEVESAITLPDRAARPAADRALINPGGTHRFGLAPSDSTSSCHDKGSSLTSVAATSHLLRAHLA